MRRIAGTRRAKRSAMVPDDGEARSVLRQGTWPGLDQPGPRLQVESDTAPATVADRPGLAGQDRPVRAERNRSEGRQGGDLAVARAVARRRFDDPFGRQPPAVWRELKRVVDAAGRQVLDDQVIGATDESDGGGDPVARVDLQPEFLLEPVARQDLEPGERPGAAVQAVGVGSNLFEGRPARTCLTVEADPDRDRRV